MTENEIRIINGKEIVLYREKETDLYRFSKDAVDMLLKAFEEREQYRAIGTVEEFKAFRSNDFTEDLLNMGYTKGLKDGYAKAIDEFAKKLKAEILEEIHDVSERQRNYEVGSDMSLTCSHIMGTLRDVYHRIIDEIAEQLKGV